MEELMKKLSAALGLECRMVGRSIRIVSPTGLELVSLDTWKEGTMLAGVGGAGDVHDVIHDINYPEER